MFAEVVAAAVPRVADAQASPAAVAPYRSHRCPALWRRDNPIAVAIQGREIPRDGPAPPTSQPGPVVRASPSKTKPTEANARPRQARPAWAALFRRDPLSNLTMRR